MNRRRVVTMALAAAAAGLPWPRARAAAATKTVLLQGIQSMSFASIYVARGARFFEKEGVDVDVQIVRGAPAAFQGVVGGQGDFGAMGATELITAAAKGLKSVIAVAPVNGAVTMSLAIRKDVAQARNLSRDTPIRERISKLRGLRIATASPGGGLHTNLMYMLKQVGLDPARDVNMIFTSEMLPAMRAGQVDAFAVSPPAPELAEAEGFGLVLVALARGEMPELGNIAYDALVARREFAEKSPDTVRRVVRAMGHASNYIRTNAEGTEAVLLKFFERTPPPVMKAIVGNLRTAFAANGRYTEEMWKNAMEFNVKAGKIQSPLDTREGVLWTNAYNDLG